MNSRSVTILLLALFLLGAVIAVGSSKDFSILTPSKDAITPGATIYIGTLPIEVEIADTKEKRAIGLTGRDRLRDGRGILFVFPEDGIYNVWMQDISFPLDVMWINSESTVVWVEANLLPESYPKTFSSPEPARYILQTNSGVAESFSIAPGTRVILPRLP